MSARIRLTLTYLAGLVATAVALGVAVSLARTAGEYGAVGREALAISDVGQRILQQAATEGPTGRRSLLARDSAGRLVLRREIAERLEALPGVVIVTDLRGGVQFTSQAVRDLDDEDWLTLQRAVADIPSDGPAGVISLSAERILVVAHAMGDSATGVARIAAGVRLRRAGGWPRQLTTTMVVVVPLIVAVSVWGIWAVLGGLFRRIERIRREVADITDGRSLHRRLSADDAGPELTALIETLNSMITRLEGSFAVLRRFTADASHELKTPLAVLRADVERSMNTGTRREDRLVALEEALQEVTRMTDLVESLLTLARADEGHFELHREPVDMRELTQEVYETALILGEAAGVNVNLPFTADVTIQGDRKMLRQLLLNLVTNAIKYTPPGGRVDIGLGRHPETVTFAVRDTGVGIAAADLPHIFERFYRADRARSRTAERGGFGLGLAISQWIAQAHGGTLTAASRLGKGSLFTLTLPLSPDDAARAVHGAASAARPTLAARG